jgi:RNA polymerase I-specific transcription initiation factor RRN3
VESADKLDAMLVLLLDYVEKQLLKSDDMRNRLFQQLMEIFEERIVMTHRSKFVQYILFYLSSQVEKYGRAFGDRLLRVFMDESTADIRRQSSILYLASYLARANFIPVNIVR